jgi:uncharacterized protein
MGLKATLNDSTALVAPARTYDTVNNAPSGGLYYSFSKYQIMIEEQLDLTQGVDPALNNPVQAFDRVEEYSVVTFNMENLYDYRDDPFDGCDFAGNSGCPGVSPPFDYVPASEEAYLTRLYDIAEQIVTDMHSPDIIMTQEIEDQDICTLSGDMVVCGTTNNADGSPDPLQDLAVAILSLGGPLYDSAYDRDGADDRGIVSAYLFRSDRVEVLPADMDHPVLGSMPTVEYRADGLAYNYDVQNPKAFNAVLPADVDRSTGTDGSNVFTRPPQVGFFRIWRDMIGYSVFTDVYLLDNHFSSTPTGRVGQRTEQALYNAAIVDALEMAFGDPRVVVGGDLNVYPRPDDPFFPGDLLFPSDQLGPLYDQGLTNLWDVMVADVPVAAFSYNFQGQTQTLDQLFNNTKMLDDLIQVRAAHINADFPADYDGDGARGTSDHDPSVARFTALPDLERLMDLVVYYQMSGDITGRVTARILLFHLKQAGLLLERGDLQGYMDQLTAFINQTRGFTPVFIDQLASDALVYEAQLLLGMGGSVSSLTIIDNSANQ